MEEDFISVGMYFYGENISLNEVSQLVGLEPTSARARGDIRITHSGVKVIQNNGFWEFREKVKVESLEIFLLKITKKIGSRIVGKAGVTKAELDIFLPIDPDVKMAGFSFEIPNSMLEKIHNVGFDLIFTVR